MVSKPKHDTDLRVSSETRTGMCHRFSSHPASCRRNPLVQLWCSLLSTHCSAEICFSWLLIAALQALYSAPSAFSPLYHSPFFLYVPPKTFVTNLTFWPSRATCLSHTVSGQMFFCGFVCCWLPTLGPSLVPLLVVLCQQKSHRHPSF